MPTADKKKRLQAIGRPLGFVRCTRCGSLIDMRGGEPGDKTMDQPTMVAIAGDAISFEGFRSRCRKDRKPKCLPSHKGGPHGGHCTIIDALVVAIWYAIMDAGFETRAASDLTDKIFTQVDPKEVFRRGYGLRPTVETRQRHFLQITDAIGLEISLPLIAYGVIRRARVRGLDLERIAPFIFIDR